MRKVKLVEIAHARSGDKGDISNVGLIAFVQKGYEIIKEKVTAARVKEHFGDLVKGEVIRYELPNILALNFVMHGALGGGGARSLTIAIEERRDHEIGGKGSIDNRCRSGDRACNSFEVR